jgi:type II secretory pathway component PulK
VNAWQVAEAVIDWRTAANPETGVCAGQNPPCHDGPLASVDELRLVPGMTPELFSAIAPYVTIYGGPLPNVNTADPRVLRAWGLPDAQVDEIVTRRQTQPFDAYPGLSVQSTAFTVSVEAWLPTSSLRTRLQAVIDRDGHILAWSPQ